MGKIRVILVWIITILPIFTCLAQGDMEQIKMDTKNKITRKNIADVLFPWWKTTTIYQIYPRSFKDTDNNGIGDLEGIISKLDYIKSMGFETIWISPFFKSPQKDFGYDISDYYSIEPDYGSMETVDRLISEVHQRDMRIVFDMVMNHSSDQHDWFLESKSARDNPKSDWYIWKEGNGNKPPNNWKSILGERGWHYVEERDQWYFASFLPFQPDLNYRNPEVKEAMFDVVRFWLNKGVDGFRLDIFNVIFKDARFRDNPTSLNPIPSETRINFQVREHTCNLPENFEFAKELRKVVDEFKRPGRMLLGEVLGDFEEVRKCLGENNDGLHLIFLFDIMFFDFKASFFREKIKVFEERYPAPFAPTYVFSNHDQKRSMTRLGDDHDKAKLLAMMQLTVRGVPVIYQGEEIGMTNTPIPKNEILDPLAGVFSWVPGFMGKMLPVLLNRDEVRTPVQWTSEANAGFCPDECATWLPVNENYKEINVERQLNDGHSLANVYKELLSLRSGSQLLKMGRMEIPEQSIPDDVLAYRRQHNDKRLLVLMNFSKKSQKIPNRFGELEEMFSINKDYDIRKEAVILGPYNGLILKEAVVSE